MQNQDVEIFYPTSPAVWRDWLEKNHLSKQAVWLVFYKKSSDKKSISWSESVDVALCFGWIDSKKIKIDEEKSHQYFSRRKPKSTWSKINKEKVRQLIESGQITEAGFKSIDIAKKNGSWNLLDEVDSLKIPNDLDLEFTAKPKAKEFFLSLSISNRKSILLWLVLARRPETRQKRISEIIELALQNQKPKHLQ